LGKLTSNQDNAANAVWTESDLLTDSVYRFKGQSAPAVVFCEIDFDVLDDRVRAKLFVGMTRAQLRLDVITTEKAASCLIAVI